MDGKVIARFWQKVDKNGPKASGLGRCWIWKGALYPNARIKIDGVIYGATRVSWELAYGAPPKGHLRQKCRHPSCVNPEHFCTGVPDWHELLERFWSRVDKRGPDECWEWTRGRHRQGYGHFWDGTVNRYAHHVAWLSEHGAFPRLDLLHSCDNPPCCNPRHLREGTHAENMRDMDVRGRRRNLRGENHPHAKLTADTVRAIRAARAAGETQRDVARRFGTSQANVGYISQGKAWKHVR